METPSELTSAPPRLLPRTSPVPRLLPAIASRVAELLYRAFEILFALTVLVLTSPIMLVIALLIKRGSPGPALFFQDRMGRDTKPFRFVKFRTMHADARQRFPELYEYNYHEQGIENLVFKIKNDPRLTTQGRWLRKTSLDELPNFWNVLTGDMALVGPRPEIPDMLKYYDGEMRKKFSVRPGVTGLAQVSGRGNLGFLKTVELDLQYVRERSVWLDLKILFKSIRAVCAAAGAF